MVYFVFLFLQLEKFAKLSLHLKAIFCSILFAKITTLVILE